MPTPVSCKENVAEDAFNHHRAGSIVSRDALLGYPLKIRERSISLDHSTIIESSHDITRLLDFRSLNEYQRPYFNTSHSYPRRVQASYEVRT